MRPPKQTILVGCAALALIATMSGSAAAQAKATTQTCRQVAPEFFEIDGMLDDWKGLPLRVAGGGKADASFALRCAFDKTMLFLSIDVRDDSVLRTKKARLDHDDSLLLQLSVGRGGATEVIRLFPGVDDVAPKRVWNNGKPPRGVVIEDTRQQHGWSVELAIPFARIRGFGKSTPALAVRITYSDGDKYGEKIQETVGHHGTLELSSGTALLASFLGATKLRKEDLRLDVLVNVDDDPGAERVVAGGAVVGVLGDSFHFFELPVASPADVVRVKVVDLEGKGRAYLVAEYRQRGNGGSRDVVGIWRFGGAHFDRIFAFEARKQLGPNTLSATWSFTPPGKHRKLKKKQKRGFDLVIEAGKAVGWDEDSYPEQPADDVKAILLPWEDQTSAVYWFESGVVAGGDPKRGR
ncbi:MAG TPA: hypothetical protein VML75_20260 [Kofleriaceae bacterium]|nr:hypothetical protein [Kofleriaceae bacterium]